VNFPLLDVFLSMLWFFIMCLWVFIVAWTVVLIFRSRDMSGWAKAAWLIFIVLVPLLGIAAYLIARGARLAGDQVSNANLPQDEGYRAYQRSEAQGRSGPDER
jgi:hypothetical protein